MFHVQPFHIFAFYFVLCCGLVDFLKSSVFCENYTGAQGPPLYSIGGGRPGVRLIPKKTKEALFMSWLVVTIFHGGGWWGNLGVKDLKAYDELNLILGLFGFFRVWQGQ